jgi:heptosyltransferase-2
MKRILVIQTAFIGDAILGTALLEKLHHDHPDAQLDYLVRKGNESLFEAHPFLNEILIWDKSVSKYAGLWKMLRQIRSKKYDAVFNIQRYAASGILTGLSGASTRIGYKSNPFSFLFSQGVEHRFGKGFESVHEVDRVLDLYTKGEPAKPRLYPPSNSTDVANKLFVTIAPASVWFTKQFPTEKWIEFIDKIPSELEVVLIGGPTDRSTADEIANAVTRTVQNLTGKLKLLETAALMKNAKMNYANDSAPVHLASAVNAPITEVFCSTVPEFGFTPLSDNSNVVQTDRELDCRPCGIHGKTSCPRGHFDCANSIGISELLNTLPSQ